MDQTIAYIEDHLESLRGDYICVSNVHTTVMAYRDESYRKVQNSGAMGHSGRQAAVYREQNQGILGGREGAGAGFNGKDLS